MTNKKTEQIVEDTIKYANDEISRIKKNNFKTGLSIFVGILIIVSLFMFVFKYEIPTKYNDKLIEVLNPVDRGIDLQINLSNYSEAKAKLVKADDESYYLYVNVTRTLATKLFKDNDKTDHMLRVGNGMILDFQSKTIRGYIPNGLDASVITRIYYIDNLSNKILIRNDDELIDLKDKTLIWEK